jgi:tRNA A37 threonylcarbamoyladenosine dehydratase
LGAVGSYVVAGLARAGVGHVCLVDFDVIRESNINRHVWAFESTIGKSKVRAGCAFIKDINSHCSVVGKDIFVDQKVMDEILTEQVPDLVIDAIDSLNPKTQVLAACHRRGIRVVSAMGAALRTDPFQIQFGDIFESTNCPLAFRLRKRLRRLGIERGIWCVYSKQPHQKKRGVLHAGPQQDSAYSRGRPRSILGSLPTITGIFGLVLAHCAIEMLCGGFETETK